MKKLTTVAALVALTFATAADAHRAWIKPDATVLSKENAWVTFDAVVSNEIFARDHVAFRLDGITAYAPDGSEMALENTHTGRLRSVFDLQLTQQGTYKIALASTALQARWVDENGDRKMWPGRGVTPKPGDFERMVPKQAKDLIVSEVSRRVETYVTNGAPTDTVLAPTNRGFELTPMVHPNDLYAEESAQFKLTYNGEPAVGAEVTVIKDGMRYRDQQGEIIVHSDNNGEFEITWPESGQYFMEISYQDDQGKAPATVRRGSYSGVFEVL